MAAGGLKGVIDKHPRMAMGLGLFLALVCARYPILTDPPYWDAAIGPFAEALWLKSNHFDYFELIRNQPRFSAGGPAVYLWSVVPTFYAVLYSVLAPEHVFVVLHVLTLALAALIAVLCYGICRDLMGLSARVSACATAAMLCQPIYTGQIDAINMEIPVAAFILLSANAMLRKHHWQACAFAVAGLLVKDSASVVCLSNLVFAALLAFLGKRHDNKKPLLISAAIPVLLGLLVIGVTPGKGDVAGGGNSMGPPLGLSYLTTQLTQCVPDVVLIYVVAVAATFAAIFLASRARKHAGPDGAPPASLTEADSPHVYSLLAASVFLGCFVCMHNPAPRCFAAYLPFFFLAFCAALDRCRIGEGRLFAVFLLLLSVNAANNQGVFYPRLPETWGRSGELLERSQEARRDLQSQLRLAAFLEEYASDRAIVTTWPLVQVLTVPELGYVSRPLNIFTFGAFHLSYAPTRDVGTLSRSVLAGALLIYHPHVFDTMAPYSLKPREFDKIVYTETVGGSGISVYVLRSPPATTEEAK